MITPVVIASEAKQSLFAKKSFEIAAPYERSRDDKIITYDSR